MFTTIIEDILEQYSGLLSDAGGRAFIARCVREGYTSNPEYQDIAASFFEHKDVDDAGISLGSRVRELEVAAAIAPRLARRIVKSGSAEEENMFDCEAEGLFAHAACVAESMFDFGRVGMYQRLNEFIEYGPGGPDFDESLLFYAADLKTERGVYAFGENRDYILRCANFLRERRERKRLVF